MLTYHWDIPSIWEFLVEYLLICIEIQSPFWRVRCTISLVSCPWSWGQPSYSWLGYAGLRHTSPPSERNPSYQVKLILNRLVKSSLVWAIWLNILLPVLRHFFCNIFCNMHGFYYSLEDDPRHISPPSSIHGGNKDVTNPKLTGSISFQFLYQWYNRIFDSQFQAGIFF